MIQALLESPAVSAVGWSLVAFVWQGALIGAVTAVVLWAFRGRDPRWRYAAACLGLLVMTALPLGSAFRYLDATAPLSAAVTLSGTGAATAGLLPTAIPRAGVSRSETSAATLQRVPAPQDWLPLVVCAWLAGVLLLSLRLAGGWLVVRRMARRGVPAGEEVSRIVRRLARRIHVIPPVRALESTLVDVPTVIGWLRPVVLIPAGAIAGLSPEQLEAVIAHELAHVRRYDYLVNLLQRVSETLFFYHPAVWWLSNRIRTERELCADDVAVAACGDATLYAEALRDLEATRRQAALAMAATGGSLAARIGRLLGQPTVRERWSPAGLAVTVVLIGLAAAGAGSYSPVAATPASPPEELILQAVVAGEEAPPASEQASRQEAIAREQAAIEEAVAVQRAEAARVQAVIGEAEATERIEAAARVEAVQEEAARVRSRAEALLQVQDHLVQIVPGGLHFEGPTLRLGLRVQDITPELREFFGAAPDAGVLVSSVEDGSAAATAGIRVGDVIVAADGNPVAARSNLTFSAEIDDSTVTLTIVRDRTERDIDVALELPQSWRITP